MVEVGPIIIGDKQLFFDPVKHRYFDETDRTFPSVTQILKPAFILDSNLPEFSEIIIILPGKHGEEPKIIPKNIWRVAQRRGTFVHQTVELYERGTLNQDTLHPKLKGYLQAWEKAKSDFKIAVVDSEQPVASLRYWYAGRLDILCRMGRQSNALTLIDIKSGQKYLESQAAAQTAAYKEAYNEHIEGKAGRITDRYTFWIHPDGTYQHEHQTDGNDLSVFLGLVNQQRWRK